MYRRTFLKILPAAVAAVTAAKAEDWLPAGQPEEEETFTTSFTPSKPIRASYILGVAEDYQPGDIVTIWNGEEVESYVIEENAAYDRASGVLTLHDTVNF